MTGRASQLVSQLLLLAFSYSSYTVGGKGFLVFGYQTTPTEVDGSTYFLHLCPLYTKTRR